MKNLLNSIRVKLFFRISLLIIIVMMFIMVVNNVVLESFFYLKKNTRIQQIINQINSLEESEYKKDLEKIAIKEDIDVIVKKDNEIQYSNAGNYMEYFKDFVPINYDINYSIFNKSNVIYSNEKTTIRKMGDSKYGEGFIIANSKMDDNKELYIKVSTKSIMEDIQTSTEFLSILSVFVIVGAGVYIFLVSKFFTTPIIELKEMTERMKQLDFSKKYKDNHSLDEINELGVNINALSDKLEDTIEKLKKHNIKLEQDIEEKSKIDEMRKQFISDVSHELKTPISLIQGYSEGLLENVNEDEESRKFYASVIFDEANKMDKLVKKLLELMKIENGYIEFNNQEFDMCSLIEKTIRNSNVLIKELDVKIDFEPKKSYIVCEDEFYIEQIITNYFINALKHVKENNGKKLIKISIKETSKNKIRISVFNTGDKLNDEELNRIWNRFYKLDKSRNRIQGGSGIGLSIVKAIMIRLENEYGVINKKDGVEFFFEIDKVTKK